MGLLRREGTGLPSRVERKVGCKRQVIDREKDLRTMGNLNSSHLCMCWGAQNPIPLMQDPEGIRCVEEC